MSGPPLRKYREWDEEDMKQAIRAIKDERKAIYKVAKEFNVPQSTLDDRYNQRHTEKVGRPTKLSPEDEEALVKYSMYMATKGFPLTAGVMKALAKEIDAVSSKEKGEAPRFGGKLPGKRWWSAFKRRHPEISLRSPDSLDRARAAMSNARVVEKHFEQLGQLLSENKLHDRPFQVYNADETGMSMDARKSRVVVPTASKRAPSIRSGGRDHITAMSCVSAAGAVVPPMIVFNRAMPSGKFSEGGPPGALYAWSESGFINKELFEEWFFKVFLVHCHKERPILLIVDQHSSHLSLKVLKTAMEQNIIIYGLPPHTSHFTQPLDVTVFSSLKTKWATTLESLQAADTRFQVRKTTFPKIFASVQDLTFTPENIKSGFKKTGILPYNKSAIDSIWTNMSPETKSASGEATATGTESANAESASEAGTESANAESASEATATGTESANAESASEATATGTESANAESTSEATATGTESANAKRSNSETCCSTCGRSANPLVGTLVPEHLQDILRPVESAPNCKQTKRRKLSARVMTHEDIVKELEKKEEDEKMKKAKAEERRKRAELTRLQREAKAKEREDKKRKRQMEKENEEKDKEMEKEEEENEMDPQNEEDEREQNGKCQGDGSKRRRIKKRDSCYEYDF
ncbi:hypothetical protein Bbelb_357910 [Branchiostoma belcheri]|nr:hypothetical protein Bbelb_357910 [Branchiostoma belcheri]